MSDDTRAVGTSMFPAPQEERELFTTSTCNCRGGNVLIDPAEEGWTHLNGTLWRTYDGAPHNLPQGMLLRPCKVCNGKEERVEAPAEHSEGA